MTTTSAAQALPVGTRVVAHGPCSIRVEGTLLGWDETGRALVRWGSGRIGHFTTVNTL